VLKERLAQHTRTENKASNADYDDLQLQHPFVKRLYTRYPLTAPNRIP
jgi:hypothetical protein